MRVSLPLQHPPPTHPVPLRTHPASPPANAAAPCCAGKNKGTHAALLGYTKVAASKKKEGPLGAKLEPIYQEDPNFNKYASLANTKFSRIEIKDWFNCRRQSAKRQAKRLTKLELLLAAN